MARAGENYGIDAPGVVRNFFVIGTALLAAGIAARVLLAAERIATMTARQAVPRAGAPDEAAEAYLYLIRGTYTTGQVLRVDGGMSLT